MKLSIYIDESIIEECRYIILENDITIMLTKDDKIKDYCSLEKLKNVKPEEVVKDDYNPSNYTYEKCDTLEIIAETLTIDDLVCFIKNNDLDHFKKIEVTLNENMYSNICDLLKIEELKDCTFKLPNNSTYITYEELEETSTIIDNITKNIENLSPLEQVMYLYDIVRDRVYEDDIENKSESRDLTKVLLGSKIVCLGYANLFDTLLKKLNISSRIDLLINKKANTGHARNIVYIDDPKYNLKCLSVFDPTFDSKNEEDDISFLESYMYFLKPYDFFLKKEKSHYTNSTIPFFNYTLEELKTKLGKSEFIPNDMALNTLKSFYALFNMIGKNFTPILLISEFSSGEFVSEKALSLYSSFLDYLVFELKPEDFASCVINVRKKQQEISKEKYGLDEDTLTDIIYNRYRECLSSEEELLRKIFGQEIFDEDKSRLVAKKVLGKNNQSSIQKVKK